MRETLRHAEPVVPKLSHLVRVVGHETHRPNAQFPEHPHGYAIVPLVLAKPKRNVGIDGIEPVLLQLVSADLVPQADPSTLLSEVKKHARGHRTELTEAELELLPAVAAKRGHHVTGEALGVDSRRDRLHAGHFAADDRDLLAIVTVARENVDSKVAELRGQ
jgi:hypothetical protein